MTVYVTLHWVINTFSCHDKSDAAAVVVALPCCCCCCCCCTSSSSSSSSLFEWQSALVNTNNLYKSTHVNPLSSLAYDFDGWPMTFWTKGGRTYRYTTAVLGLHAVSVVSVVCKSIQISDGISLALVSWIVHYLHFKAMIFVCVHVHIHLLTMAVYRPRWQDQQSHRMCAEVVPYDLAASLQDYSYGRHFRLLLAGCTNLTVSVTDIK